MGTAAQIPDLQQAEALKRRDFRVVDWDNIIEEIEALGRAESNNWKVYCARSIEHLLKIECYREATEKLLKH